MKTSKICLILSISIMVFLIATLTATGIFSSLLWKLYHNHERTELSNGAQTGWSRQKVISKLGKPKVEVASLKEISDIRSWNPIPIRPVNHRLLIFQHTFWRIYVYVNKHGNVEYTQLSRT